VCWLCVGFVFFFNDTATTEIYTLSLHDALPISLGHPLGMSGTRLALTATHQMTKQGGKRALATMCVGVGQGVSLAIERV